MTTTSSPRRRPGDGRKGTLPGVGLCLSLCLCLSLLLAPSARAEAAAPAGPPLELPEVLASVVTQYPPYLAALIERDIAAGRLRSAGGAFDLNTFARVFGNPAGTYESVTFETGVEQFLGIWGATVYGGYRLTEGMLPDYYARRTQGGGEPRVGLKIPLLQDGSIDPRRAAILKARLDQEFAEPSIRRQHLDFTRAAMVAYYTWLAAGHRLGVTEDLLRLAQDRQEAIQRQIARGLTAPIVQKENQQLVVSREIAVVRARRRFEAASLMLALFYRDTRNQPVVVGRERLTAVLPPAPAAEDPLLEAGIQRALAQRPEIRQLELSLAKLGVDLRLARNSMLPRLDAGVEASQGIGEELYKDRGEFELKLGVELSLPLQRNRARGQIEETRGRVDQLERQLAFARDRIVTEVRNTHLAVVAAHEQLERAGLNVELAQTLREVERDRFQLGATDLLALQWREQAAFQARVEAIDAAELSFVSHADFLVAIASDLRPNAPP